jgi:hypothetical protein
MVKYAGKIFLCALSSMIGTFVGGMLSTALRLEQPKLPESVNLPLLGLLCFVAGIVLSVALAALSPSFRGNHASRFAIIAWFVFAWLGINNTIEASIFTSIGGGPTAIVSMLFLSVFVAGAVVLLFTNREREKSFSEVVRRFFHNRTAAQWAIRFSLAVLAFPVVYFFFGMPVGLMVGKFYQAQSFGLQLPSLDVVIGVQFIRSLIALLTALPILIAWTGSRHGFGWTFGLNLFVVAGLYGIMQAYWMPWTLRSIHTVELFLDSMVYAWLVAALLLPREPAPVRGVSAPNYTI